MAVRLDDVVSEAPECVQRVHQLRPLCHDLNDMRAGKGRRCGRRWRCCLHDVFEEEALLSRAASWRRYEGVEVLRRILQCRQL